MTKSLFHAAAAMALALATLLASTTTHAAAIRFTNLDRQDRSNHVGAQLGVTFVEDPDGTLLRTEVFGQWTAWKWLGGYMSFPFANGFFDVQKEFIPGNFEAGAFGNFKFGPIDTTFKTGFVAPTGRVNGSIPKLVQAGSTGGVRLTDLIRGIPLWVAFRNSATARYNYKHLFLQADGGIDVAIDRRFNDVGRKHNETAVIGRGNIGIGGWYGPVTLSTEFMTTQQSASAIEGIPDRAFYSWGFSIIGDIEGSKESGVPNFQPHLSVSIPFSKSIRFTRLITANVGIRAVF